MLHFSQPLIGITPDLVPSDNQNGGNLCLNVEYFNAIQAAGGLPVGLPPNLRETTLDPMLERLDGVLLAGSLEMDARALTNEFMLIRRIIDLQIPVLAIGLGMQQLTVASGGQLYRHLPKDQPQALVHREPYRGVHHHAILVEPGTRLEEIYGGSLTQVNSSHQQAVRKLGGGLQACARGPDGVIEAIESIDPGWFCIGVQWHPEAKSASSLDRHLFESLVQACHHRLPQPLRLAA